MNQTYPSVAYNAPAQEAAFIGMETQRKFGKANPFLLSMFAAVLLTTLLDVNIIIAMVTGQLQAASWLILAICVSSYFAFRFKFVSSLGKTGMLFVVVFVGYTFFTALVRFANEFDSVVVFEVAYWIRSNLTSVVILLACAVGSYYSATHWGPDRTAMMVFCVLLIQVVGVFVAPMFGGVVGQGLEKQGNYEIDGRSNGFMANPNETGILMAATAAVGFACLQGGQRRTFILIGLGFAAVACFLTFSRSAWITFFGITASQALYSPVFRKKGLLIGLAGLVLAFIWFVTQGVQSFEFNASQQRRMESIGALTKGEVSEQHTGHRIGAIMRGIKAWSENPVLGRGLGIGATVAPHNQFIMLLVDGSFLVLIVYIAFFWVFFRSSWTCRLPLVKTFAMGIFLVYLGNNLVDHGVPSKNYFAALLGITFGLLAAAEILVPKKKNRRRMRTQPTGTVTPVGSVPV